MDSIINLNEDGGIADSQMLKLISDYHFAI